MEPNEKYFTKIKVDPSKPRVDIWYEQENAHEARETFKVESKDQPHPDFDKALQELKGHVITTLELDEDYKRDMTIRGVKVSRNEFGVKTGLTVTALKEISASESPAVLNTPNDAWTTDETDEALEALCQEAEHFLAGKRKQGDLFASRQRESVQEFQRGMERMSDRYDGIDAVHIEHEDEAVQLA